MSSHARRAVALRVFSQCVFVCDVRRRVFVARARTHNTKLSLRRNIMMGGPQLASSCSSSVHEMPASFSRARRQRRKKKRRPISQERLATRNHAAPDVTCWAPKATTAQPATAGAGRQHATPQAENLQNELEFRNTL